MLPGACWWMSDLPMLANTVVWIHLEQNKTFNPSFFLYCQSQFEGCVEAEEAEEVPVPLPLQSWWFGWQVSLFKHRDDGRAGGGGGTSKVSCVSADWAGKAQHLLLCCVTQAGLRTQSLIPTRSLSSQLLSEIEFCQRQWAAQRQACSLSGWTQWTDCFSLILTGCFYGNVSSHHDAVN